MSLSPSYLESLSRLPKTRPLREFAPGLSGVFLRHDVDHDLDLALEMAFWEREAGHRATYFILPTADYASDPRLLPKLRQIQGFGHEVGVHLNFLASWILGDIASVREAAASLLGSWREAGLELVGCAAHGDRACYESSFINYWMFRELRPEDPAKTESGLSPEGIPDPDPERRLVYPESHRLRRPGGAEFPLWSVSMAELGLRYHATHLPMDRYYSDSGGSWRRTASPLEADLAQGSHQILMHPEYYRGKPRRIFVVSTARSGSKWLAQVAAAGTSCRSMHEFSLNHRYDDEGRLVPEKRTGSGFASLQRHPEEAGKLLLHTRRYVDDLERDYFECNVYLTHFLHQLRLMFPEARIVHLHRDPREVVRSILNREWYDTPEDSRHPEFNDPAWARASQFERACLYVAKSNEQIMALAEMRVALESLAQSLSALGDVFRALGVAFYPLLAKEAFGERVNANTRSEFPSYEAWPAERKAAFRAICRPTLKALGYAETDGYDGTAPGAAPAQQLAPSEIKQTERTLFDLQRLGRWPRLSVSELTYAQRAGGLDIELPPRRHAHLLLKGGRWARIRPFLHGWRSDTASYLKVRCRAALGSGSAVVYALFYGATGKLIRARPLATLSPSLGEVEGTFRVNDAACRWLNIALYFPKSAEEGRRCRVENLTVRKVSLSLYR